MISFNFRNWFGYTKENPNHEEFLHCKSDQALEQAAQGGGKITNPGNAQETARHGT